MKTLHWVSYQQFITDILEAISSGWVSEIVGGVKYLRGVVGVPRAGMIPATIIGETLGVPVCSFPEFIEGKLHQSTKRKGLRIGPEDYLLQTQGKWLIIDDSHSGGDTYRSIVDKVHSTPTITNQWNNIKIAVIYTKPEKEWNPDLQGFKAIDLPRMFEWSLSGRRELENTMVDFDGVLCPDPKANEGDKYAEDNEEDYIHFLNHTEQSFHPRRRLRGIVTNRLHKYFVETSKWLRYRGIDYERLVMANYNTAEKRRQAAPYGEFKATTYHMDTQANLFIESSSNQSEVIAVRTNKPVLDWEKKVLLNPDRWEWEP